MINSIEELALFMAHTESVLVYGAGETANLFARWCRRIGVLYKIKGFCVSDISEIKVRQMWRRPIMDKDAARLLEGVSILVVTTEKWHSEIREEIRNCPDLGKGMPVDFLGDAVIYMLRHEDRGIQLAEENRGRLELLYSSIEKRIPNNQLAFSVHLCEHCNLNCAGCNNFAPYAKEEYLDIAEFERDMKRLSLLSGGGVAHRISLTGGEPLLNKQAIEYAVIARENFPIARIGFISNGILLQQQTEEFFEKCREYDIAIDLSFYPIGLDYEALEKELKERGIRSHYHNSNRGGNVNGIWRKETLVLSQEDPDSLSKHNWLRCYMANTCMQLSHGKLSCTKVSGVHHFIDYFKDECRDMRTVPQDFIDIYEVDNIQEIFDFFARPLPFCKYCDTDNWIYDGAWEKSEKKLAEWITSV